MEHVVQCGGVTCSVGQHVTHPPNMMQLHFILRMERLLRPHQEDREYLKEALLFRVSFKICVILVVTYIHINIHKHRMPYEAVAPQKKRIYTNVSILYCCYKVTVKSI